jgi:membrane-bound lytic murein transglycosylase A
VAVLAILGSGCSVLRRGAGPVVPVSSWCLPKLDDDLDTASLRTALVRTLPGVAKRGDQARETSLRRFIDLLDANPDPRALRAAVLREFKISRVRDALLLTAYYEPELAAQRAADSTYRFPIYARPNDLVDVDARVLPAKCMGCRAASGRLEGQKILPYLTRADIDSGALAGRGLELAWTTDLLELFSLHIQGSGRIRLPDGSRLGVRFAGTNGRPFQSLAKVMQQRGYLPRNRGSMQDIRRVLGSLSEQQQLQLLEANERYTFFRITQDDSDPIGSLGVELTPGRSVATDPRVVPLGSIGYLVTEHYSRFVLSQDTGAAIVGAHADLFMGAGETAEITAGQTREKGTLYVIHLM